LKKRKHPTTLVLADYKYWNVVKWGLDTSDGVSMVVLCTFILPLPRKQHRS